MANIALGPTRADLPYLSFRIYPVDYLLCPLARKIAISLELLAVGEIYDSWVKADF